MNKNTNASTGSSWVTITLVLGHLAIIAGLAISALSDCHRPLDGRRPELNILDCRQADEKESSDVLR